MQWCPRCTGDNARRRAGAATASMSVSFQSFFPSLNMAAQTPLFVPVRETASRLCALFPNTHREALSSDAAHMRQFVAVYDAVPGTTGGTHSALQCHHQ